MTGQDIWPNIDYIHHTGINKVVNGMIAWEGFFLAPATGQYSFIMSCDDSCTFKMSVDDPLNEAAKIELLSRGSHTSYRDTFTTDRSETSSSFGKKFSQLVTL